jgi:hypothetical protein
MQAHTHNSRQTIPTMPPSAKPTAGRLKHFPHGRSDGYEADLWTKGKIEEVLPNDPLIYCVAACSPKVFELKTERDLFICCYVHFVGPGRRLLTNATALLQRPRT